jgi:hypothetical protein
MGLFEELKRRNVFRVGAAYLLFAWVIIQVTDTVGPALHLPEWTLALVTWISIIGFPVALFFAWAFEVDYQGDRLQDQLRCHRVDGARNRFAHRQRLCR